MLTQITLVITLVLYSIIASQSFMYVLALKRVQLKLDAAGYITFRQLIDAAMMASIKYVMYTAMAANMLLVVLLISTHGSMLFFTALFSGLMLLVDALITVKGNLPINAVINSWAPDAYPSNWFDYRDRWLKFFRYRQVAIMTGFFALVIATVF
jgi:hypothetical protein